MKTSQAELHAACRHERRQIAREKARRAAKKARLEAAKSDQREASNPGEALRTACPRRIGSLYSRFPFAHDRLISVGRL